MFRKTIALFNFKSNITKLRQNSTDVGFIGVGNMGKLMVANMIRKGLKLKVYDIDLSAAKAVEGATIVNSPKEAAQDVNVVITMLPDSSAVRKSLNGKDGILEGISMNGLHVDCSTCEPMFAQELYVAAKERGIRFLDAPLSGSITGAQAATLTFMIGGDKSDVDFVEPILLTTGSRVVHCGKSGAGQTAKLCNNLLLFASMTALSEAMNLGVQMGLDAKLLASIINTSTGKCWSSDTYSPVPGLMPNVPSSNDYQGGFPIKLSAKDLALAQTTALQCDAPLPITGLVHQLYRVMMARGYGSKDFSSVYDFYQHANNN